MHAVERFTGYKVLDSKGKMQIVSSVNDATDITQSRLHELVKAHIENEASKAQSANKPTRFAMSDSIPLTEMILKHRVEIKAIFEALERLAWLEDNSDD